jgi:hypothetical protein
MGYIQQSNTKKIYAYLTQTGKEKIITGETKDFLIKYFTLHDEDINYKIGSKKSGTTYNVPKSGFIPDITGDYNLCLPNISDATFLEKNMLIYEIQVQPIYSITPDKTNVFETESVTYTITTQNVADGTVLYWSFQGTASASDFTENTDNGSVTIISNTANFTLNVKQDNTIENDESVTMYLKDSTGINLAASTTVFLKDKPIPIATANVINQCSGSKQFLYVENPSSGSGPPYTWKVVAVDINNIPITFPIVGNIPLNWASIKTIPSSPVDNALLLETNYNNTDIYYNVYLYDSNNTEYFLLKTTICVPPVGPKTYLLTAPSTELATSDVIGSYFSGNFITQLPSATANFELSIKDNDNTQLTPTELGNIVYRFIKKDYSNPKWLYVDFDFNNVGIVGEGYGGSFWNFANATNPSGDLINYILPFTIDIRRTSYELEKPFSRPLAQAVVNNALYEFTVLVEGTNTNFNNSIDTISMRIYTYTWVG